MFFCGLCIMRDEIAKKKNELLQELSAKLPNGNKLRVVKKWTVDKKFAFQ